MSNITRATRYVSWHIITKNKYDPDISRMNKDIKLNKIFIDVGGKEGKEKLVFGNEIYCLWPRNLFSWSFIFERVFLGSKQGSTITIVSLNAKVNLATPNVFHLLKVTWKENRLTEISITHICWPFLLLWLFVSTQ